MGHGPSIQKAEIWYYAQKLKETFSYEPGEEFELTANSLGAHMKVTESSPGMGHGEHILRTFI